MLGIIILAFALISLILLPIAFITGLIEGFRGERKRKREQKLEVERLYEKYKKELYTLQDEVDGIDYQLSLLEKLDSTQEPITRNSTEAEIRKALSIEKQMQSLRMKKKKLENKMDSIGS